MVNSKGRMRKLYTPFMVLCVVDSGSIKANTKVYVQEVQSTPKDELVYIIAGIAYYHSYFRIEAKFWRDEVCAELCCILFAG